MELLGWVLFSPSLSMDNGQDRAADCLFSTVFARFKVHGFSSALFGLDWIWSPNTIVPSAAVAAVQP